MASLAQSGSLSPELAEVVGLSRRFGLHDPLGAWDAFIRQYFVYREEWNEVIRAPEFMIEEYWERGYFEGDCDCVSTLFGSGCRVLGFPCRFVAIRTDPTVPEFLHVYSEAFDSRGWRRFDATVPVNIVDSEISYESIYHYV